MSSDRLKFFCWVRKDGTAVADTLREALMEDSEAEWVKRRKVFLVNGSVKCRVCYDLKMFFPIEGECGLISVKGSEWKDISLEYYGEFRG